VRRLLLAAGVIGLLIMSAPALARAPNPRDVTATRRLVAAETRLDRALLAHRAAITKAGKGYAAMLRTHCPGALPESVAVHGTPRQRSVVKDLIKEAALDLDAADTHSVTGAERRFVHVVNRVHFTQPSLIIAAASIAEGSEPVTLRGNLCADVKAAAHNDFAADPPGTTHAVHLARQTSAGQEPYVPGATTPYLITPADRAAAKTARALNRRVNGFIDNLILSETPPVLEALLGSPAPAGTSLDRRIAAVDE
jgi:hypothetical protein